MFLPVFERVPSISALVVSSFPSGPVVPDKRVGGCSGVFSTTCRGGDKSHPRSTRLRAQPSSGNRFFSHARNVAGSMYVFATTEGQRRDSSGISKQPAQAETS